MTLAGSGASPSRMTWISGSRPPPPSVAAGPTATAAHRDRAPPPAGPRRPAGVPRLGRVQPQGACDGVQTLAAGVDRPALLEPGIPGDPDPGELCDLLPSQPGGAAAHARRQADVVRGQPGPPAAQEVRQLDPPGRGHWPARGLLVEPGLLVERRDGHRDQPPPDPGTVPRTP